MKNPSQPDERRGAASEESVSGTRRTPRLETLGRYRLASQIASGGMATVFLAMAEGPGGFEKVVALKRIHPHLAEEADFVDMFLDEARIASRIHHSSVCQVFDFGEADGTYYIAMEFLLGESLARIMKTVRKNQAEFESPNHIMLAAKVVGDVCEGLHAAHELKGRDGKCLNVVHRDVSPQNLFVTYEGNVKVVDFGIASASDRVHHTAAGQVKGKFSYMAPEQSRGKTIDRRADVWALGVVLWELLTLRRLFRRETTVETLTAMLNDDIPLPSAYNPNVPPQLDQICLKALARERDERYTTARDFGRDLVRFAGSTGQPAGMVDLAEWMVRLFPEGETKTHDRVEAARRGDFDSTTVTPMQMEVSESDVQVLDQQPQLREALDASPLGEASPDDDENMPTIAMDTGSFAGVMVPPEVLPQPASSAPSRVLLFVLLCVVALLLIVIAGGGFAWLASLGREPVVTQLPSESPATDPSPAPPPPVAPAPPVEPHVQPPPPTTAMVAAASPEKAPESAPERVAPAHRHAGSHRVGMRRRPPVATGMHAATTMQPTTQMTQTSERVQPAVPQTGRVFIRTPGGWANVYDESGRLLGQTPTTVTLPAGPHRLQLRPFGQPPARRILVNVPAGGTTRVVQTLGGD